jgi:hypothetical protein
MEDYLFESPQEIGVTSEAELILSLRQAYMQLYPVMEHVYFLQEVTTDELMVPGRVGARGQADWKSLQLHEFDPEHPLTTSAAEFIQNGIAACNALLAYYASDVPHSQQVADLKDEVKLVRALFCWWSLDLFGNLPPSTLPTLDTKIHTIEDLYYYCLNEVLNHSASLSKAADATTYGRMNYWSSRMLLAKLYLNAEAYTGQPAWQKAADVLGEIVQAGPYQLEADYFLNFAINNQQSKEIILAIPYDRQFAPGFYLNALTRANSPAPHTGAGICVWPAVYESFEVGDVRKEGLLGAASGFDYPIDGLSDNSSWEEGARIGKFEIDSHFQMNNDFPLFRYADALLMYAEALWRLDDQRALAYFNEVRRRSAASPVSEISAALILSERRRELYAEMHRRTDLIRFEKYRDGDWLPLEIPAGSSFFPLRKK